MPLVEPGVVPPRTAAAAAVEPAVARAYWRKTSALMWTVLLLWFVAGFLVHVFAPTLNRIHVLGFPIGFWFAAQGSLVIFVLGLWWFARRQNEIDEEFGVQEDV